jgi:hypothetical protein
MWIVGDGERKRIFKNHYDAKIFTKKGKES